MPTALTHRDPFAELRTRVGRMLDDVDGDERVWMPAIDVLREDGSLVVRADVPGMKKPEEIKVSTTDHRLGLPGATSGRVRPSVSAAPYTLEKKRLTRSSLTP